MGDESFMHGDLEALAAPPEPVMTVLLIGYDGRRNVLTGTRDVLWNEFMHGDGGRATLAPGNAGYEYWCPQPLLHSRDQAQPGPAVQSLLDRGKQ